MEELLSLKWNNHKSTFLHVLSVLRDKQLYTDATIACEGKFYSVHKLVLSTCSDYFSAMLDRTNCKNPIIVLKDIKCEDLEALLDYMYLGEVNVRQGDLATLIKAAECLRVKGLAVPDDEPPPRKTKSSDSQSRKRDSSRSPPAKRKRHTDVDDVRPMRPQNVDAALVHRPKSPVATISSPSSPLQSRKAPLRPSPTNKISSDQNSLPQGHSSSSSSINSSEQKQEQDASNLSDCFVKVEMVESGGTEVETYDLSSEGAFKEEGGDEGAPSGGGGEEGVGDLSNDLPEFLQQATDPGAYGHTTFVGSSSFQPNEMADWQGDGSNTGFSQVDFESAEGSSQQNAPGVHRSNSGDLRHNYLPSRPARLSRDLPTGTDHRTTSCSIISPESWRGASGTLGVTSGLSSEKNSKSSRVFKSRPSEADYLFLALNQGSTESSGSSPSADRRLSGATAHRCHQCSRCFPSNKDLQRHILVHTGERPFACPICPHRTNRKSNLKLHIFNMHENIYNPDSNLGYLASA